MGNTEQSRQPVAVKSFFDAVAEIAEPTGRMGRKSVTAGAAKSLMADGNIRIPEVVQALLSRFDERAHHRLLDSVMQGAAEYERLHGFAPDAGFTETALINATRSAMTLSEMTQGTIRLDNATSAHHDQLSLQPAMAIVGIMAQFAEATPYAAYLPADVKTNEARLAILSNLASSDFGDYQAGNSLDGIALGGNYMDSERMCVLTINGGVGPFAYIVTQRGTETAGGLAVTGSNVAMPLLRGRTALFVNGLPAGRETENYGSGSNTIAGSVTIASTNYALSGTVNTDTGAISITTSPALPAGVHLMALAYIDYERTSSALTPRIGIDATIYKMFARASRGIVKTTMDAMTQLQSELSLDPRGQALMSLRMQHAAGRHFRANQKMRLIAAGLTDTWAYGFSTQIAQKSRSDIWQNLAPILGGLSQRMANNTSNYGINTLYMTGELAAQVRGLPTSIWEPSGVPRRPGIYRLGRLFNEFDVYYTPRLLIESGGGDVSQILCVGRATETARNPIVFGDAVPPVFLPLAMGDDMVQGDGFYTRGFVEVNPHPQSAQGAALINVTGIKS